MAGTRAGIAESESTVQNYFSVRNVLKIRQSRVMVEFFKNLWTLKKCDLSAEIWDICEERKEEVENEGFKMVFELSKEIDSLKENIQEHNYEITTCKVKY